MSVTSLDNGEPVGGEMVGNKRNISLTVNRFCAQRAI